MKTIVRHRRYAFVYGIIIAGCTYFIDKLLIPTEHIQIMFLAMIWYWVAHTDIKIEGE